MIGVPLFNKTRSRTAACLSRGRIFPTSRCNATAQTVIRAKQSASQILQTRRMRGHARTRFGRWLACCLLVSLLPTAAAAAVIAGMPLQERFGPEDYAAAPVHLAVLAGNDGSMFVGNAEGVLRYDGSAWTRIELPGNSVARALAMGADGRIYVGSYDRFGYLELHPDGEYAFRDLRTRFGLEGEDRHVGNVWTVVATRNAVYFQTDRKLYRLGMDDSTRSWPLPASLRGFFGVGNALYGRVDGRGLARFDDGRLLPLTGGEVFSEQPLNAVLTQNDDLLLVGGDGFYRYRGGAVERMAGDADKLFNEAAPYLAITLSDGTVVVGTLRGELLRFDADLRFLSRVPLGPYSILAMATDAEGGLWVATEGDLLRLRMPSPWTAYSAADGIPGSIVDSAWCGGSLWVANSRGVAVAERGDSGRVRFRQVVRTELETHDLLSTEDGLLIGERFGLLWLPNGSQQAQRI